MDHAPRLERTALVVDDDKFVVSALAELLEDDGFDVHTATNGFSALRQAIEVRPSVVLLDLALPERSGISLLEDLRADAASHDVAIVVVSGYPDRLSEAHLSQIDGIVPKPFDAAELMEAIQSALQRAASRRAEVAPIVAQSHREASPRTRRPTPVHHSRGRR
jgi:DNA-binding response OmpR family regulator